MTTQTKMDRDSIKRMSHSLRAYSKTRSLTSLTRAELADMPKEVIIACASDEIGYVWHKLPKHLQEDDDIYSYGFCIDHHGEDPHDRNSDRIDGPPPRRYLCCYCNVQDVKVVNRTTEKHCDGKEETADKSLLQSFCCIQ